MSAILHNQHFILLEEEIVFEVHAQARHICSLQYILAPVIYIQASFLSQFLFDLAIV